MQSERPSPLMTGLPRRAPTRSVAVLPLVDLIRRCFACCGFLAPPLDQLSQALVKRLDIAQDRGALLGQWIGLLLPIRRSRRVSLVSGVGPAFDQLLIEILKFEIIVRYGLGEKAVPAVKQLNQKPLLLAERLPFHTFENAQLDLARQEQTAHDELRHAAEHLMQQVIVGARAPAASPRVRAGQQGCEHRNCIPVTAQWVRGRRQGPAVSPELEDELDRAVLRLLTGRRLAALCKLDQFSQMMRHPFGQDFATAVEPKLADNHPPKFQYVLRRCGLLHVRRGGRLGRRPLRVCRLPSHSFVDFHVLHV